MTRFRRSPHVVVYWRNGQLVVHEFSSDTLVSGAPLTLEVLDYFSRWRTIGGLARRLRVGEGAALHTLVSSLVRLGILESSDRPRRPEIARLEAWAEWKHDAGLFHQTTRNVTYVDSVDDGTGPQRRRRRRAPPPPVKTVEGKRVALPRPARDSNLASVLTERRTWRRFSARPVRGEDLSTLLWLTWGIQSWVDLDGVERIPLTTSPSPGARHSIEAYVLVRAVEGLPAGLYHYAAADHRLVRLRGRPARRTSHYLPTQDWCDRAGAIVFLTAVFARAQWRYPNGRTYRTLLTEVGHQGQTFCLVATALGLAPFCSMALADSNIERALGVDGISEAVLYAVGVGTRPRGVSWAPWPGTSRTPARRQAAPFTSTAKRHR